MAELEIIMYHAVNLILFSKPDYIVRTLVVRGKTGAVDYSYRVGDCLQLFVHVFSGRFTRSLKETGPGARFLADY